MEAPSSEGASSAGCSSFREGDDDPFGGSGVGAERFSEFGNRSFELLPVLGRFLEAKRIARPLESVVGCVERVGSR